MTSAPGDGTEEAADRRRAVHQFVPALIPRDATGSHTLLLRTALRAAGWRSEIFAEATHDELAGESIKVEDYPGHARPDDVRVYQFSTSSVVADLVAHDDGPLVVDYHNVTRPEHYEPWEPATAQRSATALAQLAELAPRAALGIADSRYNEIDLIAAGYRRTAVVPVLVDHGRLAGTADPRRASELARRKAPGGADWLFVGRVVPPKAQHQLVKALWAYRRLYDGAARLWLVGSVASEVYREALESFVEDLGLTGSVEVVGDVGDRALAAHYDAADVYVSLSVHEGFGIPLLEAMHAGVPVVALGAGAVPDTVGDGGLVLDRGEPSVAAAAVHRVLTDAALRSRLVEAGRRRVAARSLERVAARAVAAIATVAGTPPTATRPAARPPAAPDGVGTGRPDEEGRGRMVAR